MFLIVMNTVNKGSDKKSQYLELNGIYPLLLLKYNARTKELKNIHSLAYVVSKHCLTQINN